MGTLSVGNRLIKNATLIFGELDGAGRLELTIAIKGGAVDA